MKLSAEKIKEKLEVDYNIRSKRMRIYFKFDDEKEYESLKTKDAVGNIMQEWMKSWLRMKKIEFKPGPPQESPDIFLDVKDLKKDLLEVKFFTRKPNFDIADFYMYAESIRSKPYMLNVDYLIFQYDMSKEGVITIQNLWCKKIWEITCSSDKRPLRVQPKRERIYTIRPQTFSSDGKRKIYRAFTCKEHFISALYETQRLDDDVRGKYSLPQRDFVDSYSKYYGDELVIPEWDDIKSDYEKK